MPEDDNDNEPEFIDLAELGSKVTEGPTPNNGTDSNDSDSVRRSASDNDIGEDGSMEVDDDEEVWICRYCDRAFDTETELAGHESQHSTS